MKKTLRYIKKKKRVFLIIIAWIMSLQKSRKWSHRMFGAVVKDTDVPEEEL